MSAIWLPRIGISSSERFSFQFVPCNSVSVKTRIGINDTEDYEYLKKFITIIKNAGVKTFIIHARRAILNKLTPKQNLNIPPLNYDFVTNILDIGALVNYIIYDTGLTDEQAEDADLNEDGEVNVMMAPVKTMVGDTTTIYYGYFDNWREEETFGEFYVIFD